MKTIRKFNGSWFLVAIVLAVVVGEFAAAGLSAVYGFRFNPLTVGFVCVGLVAVITSILYDGTDIG